MCRGGRKPSRFLAGRAARETQQRLRARSAPRMLTMKPKDEIVLEAIDPDVEAGLGDRRQGRSQVRERASRAREVGVAKEPRWLPSLANQAVRLDQISGHGGLRSIRVVQPPGASRSIPSIARAATRRSESLRDAAISRSGLTRSSGHA